MLDDATIFLTGFPGFIATRLLRRLASERCNFQLLVQPAFFELANVEIERIATETGKPVSDFAFLPGDITAPNLGLSPQDLAHARAKATIVFHLAAIYDLAVERSAAMRVNVEGTRNVNQFVSSLPKLRQYHYVSTCYVAGKRTGVILETELKHEAGFRNYYEETKHLAETEVEALKSSLPVTVHRPSVVCGDSQTGETAKFDGIYYLIRYLLKWPSVLSTFNIGNNEVTLNLVPVDFVVEAMAVLAGDKRATGKTLQIADPSPLTTAQLFDTIASAIDGHPSRIRLPLTVVERSLMTALSPKLTDLPHSAVPYFFLKQTYDTSQATALLAPHGVSCPPFESYVKTIVDFAAAHPEV
ncbi:MAG TPA: SDR family oxidoreductase [Pyrinomonadaceae bacterium]|nr:SDR family oxidoreductase [Pyrinomonadaceae bacterium]